MWAALSNDVTFFQINSGRSQHAAKRLLGEAVLHLLVTDQYSAYKYIDESKRQLCWAHILRNVIAIEESVCPENQKIGEKLALIAHSVFRCHHRYIENYRKPVLPPTPAVTKELASLAQIGQLSMLKTISR